MRIRPYKIVKSKPTKKVKLPFSIEYIFDNIETYYESLDSKGLARLSYIRK